MKPINPRPGTVICRSTSTGKIDYTNDAAHMRMLTRLKTGMRRGIRKEEKKEDMP